MKTSNTDIFRCLCSDLNMPLKNPERVPDVAAIGEYRKIFLQWLESGRSDDNLFRELNSWLEVWFNLPVIFWDSYIAIRDVYQLLSFTLKIPKQYTHEQEQDYVSKFLKTEQETRNWRCDRSNPVTRLARQLIRRLMVDCRLDPVSLHGLGRHGPGAVYGHEVGTDKNFFSDPPHDLALTYGHEFLFCNSSFLAEYASMSTYDRSCRHVVSRLALVPKDYRGPRGVFVSPKEVVFWQLAQDTAFKRLAKKTWLGICYDPYDQSPSREVAYIGSATRLWDTLDLSDASDRVPLSLVAYLFNRQDYLALARTRPSYVELPEGVSHRMSMFSPMGDGKTFSVLSTIVSVLAISAMLDRDGFSSEELVPMDAIRERARMLRVFGDDIAVHGDYFACVYTALESHNLRVNRQKSFHNGFFRESCGMDAYCGHDITPLRQKVDFDSTLNYHKVVEFHNRMVLRYPWLVKTIALTRSTIEDVFRYTGYTSNSRRHPNCLQVPADEVTFIILGGLKQPNRRPVVRFNPDTQVLELLTYASPIEENSISSLNPWWDLNYWLLVNHGQGLDTGDCVKIDWISDNRIDCRGSRIASKQYEAIAHKATGKRICMRNVRLRRSWEEIE